MYSVAICSTASLERARERAGLYVASGAVSDDRVAAHPDRARCIGVVLSGTPTVLRFSDSLSLAQSVYALSDARVRARKHVCLVALLPFRVREQVHLVPKRCVDDLVGKARRPSSVQAANDNNPYPN